MTKTIPEKAGKPAAARSRLIYIGERLKELRNERDRLIEERASLKAAVAASKGENDKPVHGSAGQVRGKASKADDTAG